MFTCLLYVEEDHDVVSVDVKLKGVVGEDIVVAETPLDALQLEGGMHREQAILVELDGDGRQRGGGWPGDRQTLGQPDRLLDLAARQGAHVIRAEVAQVDDPGEREEQADADDATQAVSARVPRLHPRRRGPPVAYIASSLPVLRRDEHLELATTGSVCLRVDTRSPAHYSRHPCLARLDTRNCCSFAPSHALALALSTGDDYALPRTAARSARKYARAKRVGHDRNKQNVV